MPSRDRISSYIDLGSIRQETAAFLAELRKIRGSVEEVNNTRVQLKKAESGKEVQEGIKASADATLQLEKNIKSANVAIDTQIAKTRELSSLETQLANVRKQISGLEGDKERLNVQNEIVEAKEKELAIEKQLQAPVTGNNTRAQIVRDNVPTGPRSQFAGAEFGQVNLSLERNIALLRENKADLAALKAEEKAIEKDFKDNKLAIDDYNTALTANIAKQEQLKATIAEVSAEMKANAKVDQGARDLPVYDANDSIDYIPIDDLSKQILLLNEAKAALASNQQQQKLLNLDLKNGTISRADYNRATVQNSKEIIANNAVIRQAGLEMKRLTTANEAVDGSLAEMRVRLIQLNAEYDRMLNAEGRVSARGIQLQGEIRNLSTEILGLDRATNRAQRNVGNYPEVAASGFQKMGKAASAVFGVVRNLAYVLPGIGIAGIFALAIDPIAKFTTTILAGGEAAEKAAEKNKRQKESLEELIDSYRKIDDIKDSATGGTSGEIGRVNALSKVVQDQTLSYSQRNNALKELKEINKNYFGDLTLEQASLATLTSRVKEYTAALVNQAIVKELETDIGKVGAAYFKQSREVAKASKDIQTAQDKLYSQNGNAYSAFQDLVKAKTGENYREQLRLLQPLKAQFNELNKELEEFITNQTKFKPLEEDEGKKGSSNVEKLRLFNKKRNEELERDNIANLKAISEAENYYVKVRMDAREEAFRLESKLNDQGVVDAIRAEVEKYDAIINDPKSSKNARINAQREYDRDLLQINEDAEIKQTKLVERYEADRLRIINTARLKRRLDDMAANKDAQERFAKEAEDRKSAQLAALTGRAEREIASIERRSLEEQTKVEEKKTKALEGASGPRARKKIEERYAREALQVQIFYDELRLKRALKLQEDLLKAVPIQDQDQAEKLKKQIAELKKQISELTSKRVKLSISFDEAEQQDVLDFLGTVNDLYNQVASTIGSAIDAQTIKLKNQLQDQIDTIEKRKQIEIDAINASTAAEQDKAAAITRIQAVADAKRQQLEQRQRLADQRKAEFDKAIGIGQIIINTAIAVTKLLATPPLALAAGILGAAQLAIAISTPIPKYKMGTKNHPGGPFIAGDGGKRELVVEKDGNMFVTDNKPTLYTAGKEAMVFPDVDKINKNMFAMAFGRQPTNYKDTGNDDRVVSTLDKGFKKITNAVKSQPGVSVNTTWNGAQVGFSTQKRYFEWVNRMKN